MATDTLTRALVRHFYDDDVTPERLQDLLNHLDGSGRAAEGPGFARALARAFDLFEQLHACGGTDLDEVLGRLRGAALAVLAETGLIVALNEPARAAFGVDRGFSLRQLPFHPDSIELLCERTADLAGGGRVDDVARLRPITGDRVIHAHLRRIASARTGMRILVMTGEQLWPPSASGFLGDVFRLTPAEIDLLRHLVSGSTVQSIARGSGRRAGTIRSQIHSILEKTGAEGQAELVRLVTLILQTAALGGEASTSDLLREPRHRFLRLSDGRRMEVLMLGSTEGVPVLWLHTFHGYFRLPREVERDFARRNLRVIIPVRAGWAGSDAAPAGRDVLELAVADATELMTALGIDSATVIAPSDDIRIALMLARAAPGAVRHIVGLSCGFPILEDAQFRRLMPVSRFVRACAQYEPRVLPIAAKAFRITMLRYGIERYLRGMVARSPADSRALADPAIAAAVVAGVHYMYGYDARVESAFCAEMRAFTQPWPQDLGAVRFPVTLVHGAHDLNAPLETARDYCARYPGWRLIVFPDEGQYVGLVRWPELLDLVARRALPEQIPLPAPIPLDPETSPWRER